MKVLASVIVLTATAAARIINGAQLTPFAGANVNVATNQSENVTRLNDYEYVIVGSGAGGAPLASRLALAGYSVLLLEAGDDETSLIQQIVPGLHPISTEVEPMRWDYFIKPFDSDAENRRSEKMTYTLTDGSRYTGANPPSGAKTLGLLYPRAGTLGGCTTHNALISVTPQESDWKHLQNVSGDAKFAPATMRTYLTQLEKATYVPSGTAGHGFNGWYEITTADLSVAVEDSKTISLIVAAATKAGNRVNQAVLSTLSGLTKFLSGDANSASASRDTTQSLYRIPIAMKRPSYERAGPLDLLRQVLNAKNADGTEKYKLDVQLNTLATKVVFDSTGAKPRATGIDFSLGASLYGADPRRQSGAVTGTGTPGTVRATREVILSAGSFNTPQLLKLSGVGPAAELQSFNIPVVVNLPGVGKNLQDRYEAPVVARAQQPFDTIKNCTFGFTPDDYCMNRWKNGPQGNKGLYSSNGGPISYVMKTSQSENGDADLMILGLAGISLTGYYPGWPVNGTAGGNAWTWVTLKSHSRNNAGTVTLRSTNPQDMPEIVMRNFAVGGDADLTAAIEGTKWARSAIQSAYHPDTTFTEDWPGPGVQTDAQWKDWLKHTAWGHHACCTAKIGSASDPDAVLDGQFRVRGVDGLRVVDASSWSKIPGFYIVLPQYILGQKAADDIIAAAKAA